MNMEQILASNARAIYDLHHQLTGRLRYDSDPGNSQPLGIAQPNQEPTAGEGNKIEAGLLEALNAAEDSETAATVVGYFAKLFTNLSDEIKTKARERECAEKTVELINKSNYMRIRHAANQSAPTVGEAFEVDLSDEREGDATLQFTIFIDGDQGEGIIRRIALSKLDDIDILKSHQAGPDDQPWLATYIQLAKMPPISNEYPELIACMKDQVIPRVKQLINPNGTIEFKRSFDLERVVSPDCQTA